ncbi:His-Xaa-Ser system protein HxsD [Polyangium mundeleinium]|uniref:His-Xaa-Ser system protein HxsD n=1 Tax=Polyangium mundeleinium TaxID=2995306 RepID=A0ABT5EI03_9BACT|nr:His-Xaa-Ser system protein HxsD [Polyangium mundeleinium]MDC0740808.1 His-Xaa-Ser system protein HxsD [Polyangium mundeleinium]
MFRDGCIGVTVDVRAYRLSAVQKTAYRLAAKCTAIIGEVREHSLVVTLTFAPTTGEREALETARLFFQELLDQELREKVGEQTASLRALILAHAFSRTSLPPRG